MATTTRLRVYIAVGVFACLCGCAAAWILWPRALTFEELRVVGTWHHKVHSPDGGRIGPYDIEEYVIECRLSPDRTCRSRTLHSESGQFIANMEHSGRWWVEDGAVCCDWCDDKLMRTVRVVKDMIQGVSRVRGEVNVIESVTANELVFRLKDGTRYELKRAEGP